MILVLHTTARYAALATMATAGTALAAVLIARHLCHVTDEHGERLMAWIADQLG